MAQWVERQVEKEEEKKRSTVAGSISRWICNEYISPGANFQCRFSSRCWVRSPCASTAVGTLKIPNAGTIPQSGKYENTARTGSNGQWLIGTGAAYSLRPPEFPLKKLIKYYINTTPLPLSPSLLFSLHVLNKFSIIHSCLIYLYINDALYIFLKIISISY